LARGIVFLNHGSFGACPKPILQYQNSLRQRMESEPVQFLWRHYETHLEPSRRALARFIGAAARDVVFVPNATTAVNAVLRSLTFRPGDELLATNLDYNACHNVLVETAQRTRAKLVVAQVPFPISGPRQVVETVLAAAGKRTRLALIDHVTSHSALIFPVAQIIRELDRRGIDTLVDGAHAPGMVPLNMAALQPAYYVGNLHKWVCAPKGAGFLWARPDKQSRLQPAVISHGNNTARPGYTSFQDRFDWAGTTDPTGWFSVAYALEWMGQLFPGGWNELRRRNHRLILQARKTLCAALNVEPPCPEHMLGSMATIPLPNRFQGKPRTSKIDPEQLALYDQFGIEVPFVRLGKPVRRYFRISAQIYNSLEDYNYLATALAADKESACQ
jgi:isopenicillin-N epimerase